MSEAAIRELVQWASDCNAAPLAGDLVPGTSERERRLLAGIGGIARALSTGVETSLPDPLRLWMEDAPHPPQRLVDDVRRELPAGTDVLAGAYERIVTGRNRRRLGTFFTPPAIVEFMLDRAQAIAGTPDLVVDPGAGVGAFTIAARRRWPNARVVAVDVNLVTLGLLAARCAAEEVAAIDLVLDDYLSWIVRPENLRGGTALLVGNPPYTRHQEVPKKLKDEARSAAGDLVKSGLAGLSTYFLASSLVGARESDAICFLLPGGWTEARYGRELREAIWTSRGRQAELYAFPLAQQVFPGTRVTAMVLALGPTGTEQRPITFRTARFHETHVEVSKGTKRQRRGSTPRTFGALLWRSRRLTDASLIPLGELARVRRGVATGANSFFFLTDENAKTLPPGALLPALRRLRHVQGNVLDKAMHTAIGAAGLPRWLLHLTETDVCEHPEIRSLIEQGEVAKLHLRHLTSTREPWYSVERIPPPHIFVALMSKGHIRAVRNAARAIPSNSMYGILLPDRPDLSTALTTWLNTPDGQQRIRARARHYSDGLFKLEPKDFLSVEVPQLDILEDQAFE